MRNFSLPVLIITVLIIFGLPNYGDTQAELPADWEFTILFHPNHHSINLGTVGPRCYDFKKKQWCALTDKKKHKLMVIAWPANAEEPFPEEISWSAKNLKKPPNSNAFPKSKYVLVLSASDTGPTTIEDMNDFQVKGGDLSGWIGLGGEQPVVVKEIKKWLTQVNNIKYRYQVDEKDAPGNYQVTLYYTVTAQ